mgnify:FL=1
MKRNTRSILEEIATCAPGTTRKNIVEEKSHHVLEGAINTRKEFYQVCSFEEAQDLHKKFVNSIRTLNEKKFYNSLDRKDEV